MVTEVIRKEGKVPVEFRGMRADAVLAKLFPDYSRSQLSQWLKSGHVVFNGECLKPKDKVLGNESVILQATINSVCDNIEAENIALDIIFEDDALLIINKPAGLVVHPGAGNPNHTLVNALLYHDNDLEQLPRAGIVHRLDKETTGLLIVGKTLSAYTSLVRQMQAREISRKYKALVHGHIIAGGHIDTFFGRHPRNRLKMAVCLEGKEAITDYSILKHYYQFSLLDVALQTGRTHQIRVHMEYIKHPIVGDPLYGGRRRIPSGLSDELKQMFQAFSRQALHAYHLSLVHPTRDENLTFTAPLPQDFQNLLTALESSDELSKG